MMYPKIELHVHLEATVKAETLLEIAQRNDSPLPATTVEGLRSLYRYRDFDHFIEVWTLTTNALRRYDDFRQVVVDYADEASGHGAVYVEGIFSPIERVWRGVDWDEMFAGYCDGAAEAREVHGVEVRLTPDITRGAPVEYAFEAARYAVKYRERGVGDPQMFDTDLTRDYAAATSLGASPRTLYEAGVTGELCDEATRTRLREIGTSFDWEDV